jgi:hypothetical protein
MKSYLYHLQLNIDFKNFPFYKELMTFLGWIVIFEMEDLAGFKSGQNGDLWFLQSQKPEISDFDNRGVNHISLKVENKSDIDELVNFLKTKNVSPLFDTPRHRSEFASNEKETYYQVMFKTEDNILFEVVYIGPKN